MIDSYESVVFVCPKVMVFQVPPPTGKGFKTDSWGPMATPIFTGRLRLLQTYGTDAKLSTLDIRIEDATSGELFASAPYIAEYAVERAQDSSRYFQLRVVHEKRVAYLGLGFEERDTSFDFQVALADFLKHVNAEKEPAKQTTPVKDYSLKAGESLNINIGVCRSSTRVSTDVYSTIRARLRLTMVTKSPRHQSLFWHHRQRQLRAGARDPRPLRRLLTKTLETSNDAFLSTIPLFDAIIKRLHKRRVRKLC